ncbi:hypothetical protein BH11MYX3_BH11MYX3_16860 [soil metagenome]
MLDRPRIGELLLLEERIDPWALSTALKEQRATRQRLVSLLIHRALLDHDEGAMLLSQQLGYSAAMQRHIERRDPEVLRRVPDEIGARWVVMPLAVSRTGQLIVLARDPTNVLEAALAHLTRSSVMLAVIPALQIERLVRTFYGAFGTDEEPLPAIPPTMSDIGDIRLDRDDTPIPRRARTVSKLLLDSNPELPVRGPTALPSALESTLSDIDNAISAMAVERLLMAYAACRWRAALLAKITDGTAIGVRGHGEFAIETVELPLSLPSMVQIVHDTKVPTTDTPRGPMQADLTRMLGYATTPVAAPVMVANRVDSVLAVGDPIDGAETTIGELDRLADALGAAYERFGAPRAR